MRARARAVRRVPFVVQAPTHGLESLPMMVAGVNSSDPTEQLNATIMFRRLLSIESNPPIQAVINAGVVPRFREFLQSSSPKLQFEAAWTLTNIARFERKKKTPFASHRGALNETNVAPSHSGSSAETRAVVDSGAVPIFVQMLRSPHDQVRFL